MDIIFSNNVSGMQGFICCNRTFQLHFCRSHRGVDIQFFFSQPAFGNTDITYHAVHTIRSERTLLISSFIQVVFPAPRKPETMVTFVIFFASFLWGRPCRMPRQGPFLSKSIDHNAVSDKKSSLNSDYRAEWDIGIHNAR